MRVGSRIDQLSTDTDLVSQTLDASFQYILWAERFVREVSGLFAMQNEITSRIAIALNREVTACPHRLRLVALADDETLSDSGGGCHYLNPDRARSRGAFR